MALPNGTTVKPVRGTLDSQFLAIDQGRSISSQAESGVSVSFVTPFTNVPIVAISQHQKDAAWVDPGLITTTGFTWYGDSAESGIDWIAIGT